MKFLSSLFAVGIALSFSACTTTKETTTIVYRDKPAPKYYTSSETKKSTSWKKPSPPREPSRVDSDGRRHRDVAAENVEPAESVLRVDR